MSFRFFWKQIIDKEECSFKTCKEIMKCCIVICLVRYVWNKLCDLWCDLQFDDLTLMSNILSNLSTLIDGDVLTSTVIKRHKDDIFCTHVIRSYGPQDLRLMRFYCNHDNWSWFQFKALWKMLKVGGEL